ncbi:hypothetical protein HYDPIDRAFT_85284, partial [Hydnomerulius pinastri MD-312]
QASAVPCEPFFSSGKETDTARPNNLSPETMEMLQILKFLFPGERLSFENHWWLDVDTEHCDTLIAEAKASNSSDQYCSLFRFILL